MAQVTDIERTIRMIEVALVIGRNLVLIVSAITAVTIALAAYNFAVGSVGWGIVHSLFGLGGLVFLAQIRQTRRHHRTRQAKRRQTAEKFRKAASA